jgi:hypothetical protein
VSSSLTQHHNAHRRRTGASFVLTTAESGRSDPCELATRVLLLCWRCGLRHARCPLSSTNTPGPLLRPHPHVPVGNESLRGGGGGSGTLATSRSARLSFVARATRPAGGGCLPSELVQRRHFVHRATPHRSAHSALILPRWRFRTAPTSRRREIHVVNSSGRNSALPADRIPESFLFASCKLQCAAPLISLASKASSFLQLFNIRATLSTSVAHNFWRSKRWPV